MSGTEGASGPLLDPAALRPTEALLGAHIAVSAAIERLAVAGTGHDPTTVDLLVRLELSPTRHLRAVELCRELELSPSHVSRMLDRAEEAGLVSRGPDPDDRRASLISLTGEGRQVVAGFAPRLQAVLDQVVHQTLAPKEIDQLVDYLNRLDAAARSLRATEH